MPYSVSPRLNLMMVGLKPSWNFRTRMPTRLAARKWPSSWTKTSTPSTKTNARMVITSDLQFYRAGDLLRILAGPGVHSAHRRQGRNLFRSMRLHRLLDDVRDRQEADTSVEESRDGDLVGGVQHDRQAACRLERAIRQAQTWERGGVRHLDLQWSRTCEVERGQRRRPALGIRERVLNRQPHVGDAELCEHRSVGELHHRVHHRLRMNDDVDLIGADAEEPMRLDHLEALVHQRRRIDRDLASHPPGRMLQRLFGGDARQLGRRAAAKRSARCGEHEALDLAASVSMQALVDGVVLPA